MPVAGAVRPAALGMPAHPHAARARWRVSTARTARSGGASGPSAAPPCPLELVEILHTAPQLLCLSQVHHIMPNVKDAHGG